MGYLVVSIKFIPQNAFLNDVIRAEWATPLGRSWAVETHKRYSEASYIYWPRQLRLKEKPQQLMTLALNIKCGCINCSLTGQK